MFSVGFRLVKTSFNCLMIFFVHFSEILNLLANSLGSYLPVCGAETSFCDSPGYKNIELLFISCCLGFFLRVLFTIVCLMPGCKFFLFAIEKHFYVARETAFWVGR